MKTVKAFLIAFLAGVVFINIASGQGQNEGISKTRLGPDSQITIPEISPTGVASIIVPLWELKLRGLTVPIYLTYNTSGLRVNDIATPVGLGWELNAGGGISRIVNGLADEAGDAEPGHDWFSLNTASIPCQLDSLKMFFEGEWDLAPDIYSYFIPGSAGSFIFDNGGNIHMTRPSALAISPGFSIIDELGNFYSFIPTETTATNVTNIGQRNHSNDPLEELAPINSTFGGERVTAWGLDAIITATGDTIRYTYTPYTYEVDDYTVSTSYAHYYPPSCGEPDYNAREEFWKTSIHDSITVLLGDSIITPDEIIVFEYATDNDIAIMHKKMERILIFDRFTGDTINIIEFGHDDYPGYPKLRLDSLNIFGRTSDSEPGTFKFSYIGGSLLTMGHHSQDYYGYQNSNTAEHMIPYYSFPASANPLSGFDYFAANRNIDTQKIQIGTLKEIIYPSGGSLVFTFEPNVGSNGEQGPGLRIKTAGIMNSLGEHVQKMDYSYSGLSGYYYKSKPSAYNPNGISFQYYQSQSQLVTSFYYFPTYTSSPVSRLLNGLPGGFAYQYVTKKSIESENSVKDYITEKYELVNSLRYNTPRLTDRFYLNSDSIVVRKENFTYENLRDTTITALMHGSSYLFYGSYLECETNQIFSIPCAPDSGKMYYSMQSYEYYINPYLTSNHTITDFYPKPGTNDTISTRSVTNYQYTESMPFPRTITTSLFGDGSSTAYSSEAVHLHYPFDYADSVSLTQSLIGNGITGLTIDMRTERDGQPTSAVKMLYNPRGQLTDQYKYSGNLSSMPAWNANNLLQQGFSAERKISYHPVSNAPVSVVTPQGSELTLWGYNDRLPIAIVQGAESDQVSYTSFEELEGSTPDPTGSKTGDRYLVLSGAFQIADTLSAGTYTMTYFWRESSNNSWEYITENKQLSSPGRVSTTKASGHIDELRVLPPNSKIITTTYLPSVGKTSETDTNGKTTYYDYDRFGRLSTVRDNQGNIIRTIVYNTRRR